MSKQPGALEEIQKMQILFAHHLSQSPKPQQNFVDQHQFVPSSNRNQPIDDTMLNIITQCQIKEKYEHITHESQPDEQVAGQLMKPSIRQYSFAKRSQTPQCDRRFKNMFSTKRRQSCQMTNQRDVDAGIDERKKTILNARRNSLASDLTQFMTQTYKDSQKTSDQGANPFNGLFYNPLKTQ